MQITNLISGIISIIQFKYKLTLDTNSFNYSRFITHLRILLVRLLRNQPNPNQKLDPSLLSFMKIKYNKAYDTAERIATYLHSKMGYVTKRIRHEPKLLKDVEHYLCSLVFK